MSYFKKKKKKENQPSRGKKRAHGKADEESRGIKRMGCVDDDGEGNIF